MKSDIPEYDKLYNELYALIKLQHIDSRFKSVSVEEKLKGNMEAPDLQSSNLDYGIEVTRAYPDYVEMEYAVLRSMGNRGKSAKEISDFIDTKGLNKDLKNKIIVDDYDGHAGIFCENDCSKYHIDVIKDRLNKKNKKFMKPEFKKFKNNYLYVNCEGLLNDRDLINAVSDIDLKFDSVFFDCENIVYEYNSESKNMLIHNLNDEDLKEIKSTVFSLHKPEWANR